jgi:hypothetical protein
MAVVTTALCSCITSAARPGRQYHHILLLYISVQFIYVYFIGTLSSVSKLEFEGRCFATNVEYFLSFVASGCLSTK